MVAETIPGPSTTRFHASESCKIFVATVSFTYDSKLGLSDPSYELTFILFAVWTIIFSFCMNWFLHDYDSFTIHVLKPKLQFAHVYGGASVSVPGFSPGKGSYMMTLWSVCLMYFVSYKIIIHRSILCLGTDSLLSQWCNTMSMMASQITSNLTVYSTICVD